MFWNPRSVKVRPHLLKGDNYFYLLLKFAQAIKNQCLEKFGHSHSYYRSSLLVDMLVECMIKYMIKFYLVGLSKVINRISKDKD